MSKATITIEGFVAKAPELRQAQGKAVTNVTVPHTPRKLNRQTNQWEDAGPTLWVEASFWEGDAEAIAATVTKGTLVTITGQPELREYQKNDGTNGAALTLKFGTLGVIPRSDTSRNVSPSVANSAPVAQADAWATPGSFGDDTPF